MVNRQDYIDLYKAVTDEKHHKKIDKLRLKELKDDKNLSNAIYGGMLGAVDEKYYKKGNGPRVKISRVGNGVKEFLSKFKLTALLKLFKRFALVKSAVKLANKVYHKIGNYFRRNAGFNEKYDKIDAKELHQMDSKGVIVSFSGPGTVLWLKNGTKADIANGKITVDMLARRPVNKIDANAMVHDVAYFNSKFLTGGERAKAIQEADAEFLAANLAAMKSNASLHTQGIIANAAIGMKSKGEKLLTILLGRYATVYPFNLKK